MSETVGANGYPVKSRKIHKDAWFYEQPRGLEVVGELRRDGLYVGTTVVSVPWFKVHAALERHWKIQKRKLLKRKRLT